MPNLKQLTCLVEWSSSNLPLQEFQTSYADGYVETYIAVPAIPTTFSVHLLSRGYIAPGLAMFVYMDGEYQCNRNRTNLKIPDGTLQKKLTEIDFVVRQKEEILVDGTFRGKQWQFGELNFAATTSHDYAQQSAPQSGPHNTEYLGTIEVVVLRCYASKAHPQAVPKSLHPGSPPMVQSSKPTIPETSTHKTSFSSSDEEVLSSSSSESEAGGLYDGGTDDRRSTAANFLFGGDGNWDAPTSNQGHSNERGTPKNGSGLGSARRDGQLGSYASRKPVNSQDYDTPEIDRPRKSYLTQSYHDQKKTEGKDGSLVASSKQSPAVSTGNQSNRSISHSIPQSHMSITSPAVVINVNHAPQPPTDWAFPDTSVSASKLQNNQVSNNEGAQEDSNHEEEPGDVIQPMPGAWDETSNESTEGTVNWENSKSQNGFYGNDQNQPTHHKSDSAANNNASNWGNPHYEAGYNGQNWNADQDTNNQGVSGAWNNNEKITAPGWSSIPNNNTQQDNAAGQGHASAYDDYAHNNHAKHTNSPHPNHNHHNHQNHQNTPFVPPPNGQNPGGMQPQTQQNPNGGPILPIPVDSRPKPHWSSWKQTGGAIPKPKSMTPPVETIEPLYSVPSGIAPQNDMSHQVHVGQPAPYIHKRSTPKYMDSFESPYAVFVFKYRSKAVLEKILNTPLSEPEAYEKQRLLALSKEELVEHVLKEKQSYRNEGASATIQSRSSSGNAVNTHSQDYGNSAISQLDTVTAPENPSQVYAANHNIRDDVSTNPSWNWGRGPPNVAYDKQSCTPEVKVNSWLGAGVPRSGSGNDATNQNYGNGNNSTNWNDNTTASQNYGTGNNNTNWNDKTGAGQNYGNWNNSTNWNDKTTTNQSHGSGTNNTNWNDNTATPKARNSQSPGVSKTDNPSTGTEWNRYGTAGAWTSTNSQSNGTTNPPVAANNAPQTSGSWNNAANVTNPAATEPPLMW